MVSAQLADMASFARHKREEEVTEEEEDSIVDDYNKQRRAFAKDFNIANMNRLSWDGDAEWLVSDYDCKKAEEYGIVYQDIDSVFSKATTDQALKQIENRFWFLNCLYPLQTDIFCKKMSCGTGHRWRCACGPEDRFSKDDVEIGKAGSECSGEEDDGLCVNESTRKSTTGTILTSILIYLVINFVL
ncbi:unnamed protein product [Caenorhabditis brenneri]